MSGKEDIELALLPPPALDGTYVNRGPPAAAQTVLRRRQKLLCLVEDEMKFSHSIQFNAVPEWSSHYIAYSNLKKLIYQLEQQIHHKVHGTTHRASQDAEASPLLPTGSVDPNDPD